MTWTPRPPTDRALAIVAGRELTCRHGVRIGNGCAMCQPVHPDGPETIDNRADDQPEGHHP